MPRISLPLPLLGLRDESPAGSTQPTHYDGGENVMDYDHRAGRVGLATRPGLVPVATAGSPPALIHQVTRPLQRDAWAELTTTAATGTVPAQVSTGWTVELDEPPLAVATGPLGNGYTLLPSGVVVVTSPQGTVLHRITVPIPTGFSLVPDIGLDEEGRLYVISAYPRRINGGAGRLHRMVETGDAWNLDGESVIEWTPRAFALDRSEIILTARRPDDWDESVEADGIAPLEQVFRLAGIAGTPFVAWVAPAAAPTTSVAVSLDGESVYVSSARNQSRVPTGSAPLTPSVGWTPREETGAPERLYAHLSALRAQSVQGFSNGAAVSSLEGATHDPSDFDPVLDVRRDVFAPSSDRAPKFDTNGMVGVPGIVFTEGQGLATPASTGFDEKVTATEQAPFSRALFPNMRGASGQGAHFAVAMLFRIEAVPGGHTDTHYVFEQGDYALSYSRNGTDIDFDFEYPGGSSTLTVTGLTARPLVFAFSHAGNGDANSAWYLYDAATLYTATGLTVGINRALERTVLGGYSEMLAPQWVAQGRNVLGGVVNPANYAVGDVVWNRGRAYTCILAHAVSTADNEPGAGASASTYWTVVAKLGMNGVVAEAVTFLGATTTTPHDTAVTGTLREKLEGFVAHAYGRQGVLTAGHPHKASPPAGVGSIPEFAASAGLALPQGLTVKYDRANGKTVWVLGLNSGSGVAAAPEGYLYTGTVEGVAAGTIVRAKKHKDEGATVRSSGLDLFGVTDSTGDAWLGDRLRLVSDHCGDLYLPWVDVDGTTARSLRRYRANDLGGSTVIFTYLLDRPVALAMAGLAVDQRAIGGACGPEFLYVATQDGVKRVEVLGRARTTEVRDRELQLLVVGQDGRVERRVDTGALTSVAAAGTLGTDRPWAVNLLGKVYFGGADTDFKVFDPLKGTLTAWETEGRSARPRRLVLGTRWRNRIVGVSGDDPHVMHASAVRRPNDWDVAPLVVTATQAFAGTNAAAGNSPEPITALMPWADDLMLVGSAEGIVRVTGDPATGGQLDDVEAHDGVAYGYAWCRGPGDSLYWLSARGQLKRATPGGGIETISAGAVGRRLQEIDLSRYRVELAWSQIPEGVFVMLYRRDGEVELDLRHYFVSAATGGWHPVRFAGGHERTVTAAGIVSADRAIDSGLVFGFADGRLRRLDREAWDDDGEPLRSWVRIPLATNAQRGEMIVTDAELVTSEVGGVVRAAGLAARTATAPGSPVALMDVAPGRGDLVPIQVAGPYTWLWLEGSEPWAVYDAAIYASAGGAKR